MAENIFNQIQKLRSAAGIPARGRAAQDWFRRTIRELYGDRPIMGREQLVQAEDATTRTPIAIKGRPLNIGRMFMFAYQPMLREQLPFYDRFPLIFVIEFRKDGFLGLNMHYMPIRLRLMLFNRLTVLMNNASLNDNTRLRLSYQVIKNATKFHAALPLIREYKAKYIRSRVLEVHPRDWEIALFLPTEQFKKRGKQTIWANTRKEIREGPRKRAAAAKKRREREREARKAEEQGKKQEQP